jgi:hypothetical protein
MYIYNVTIKIEHAIHDTWLAWMKEEHIPKVLLTNCFTKCQLVRLLDIDDTDGPTYAAQYHAATKEDYEQYMNDYAPTLRKDLQDRWNGHFVAFRSLMQVVH